MNPAAILTFKLASLPAKASMTEKLYFSSKQNQPKL